MPFRLLRALSLSVGVGFVLSLTAGPGIAFGARPEAAPAAGRQGARPVAASSRLYLVQLRSTGGRTLPVRRGGLRPAATAIAKQRAEATDRSITALEGAVGFSAAMRFTYAAHGFAARLTPRQVLALRADPRVVSVRPSQPARVAGESVPVGLLRIHAAPGTEPAGLGDVSVAVVDTGISHYQNGVWRHADELNIAGGVDAYSGIDQLSNSARHATCSTRTSGPAAYDDDYGHGTHVAGTIGARNNAFGAVGVAPGVKLYSVRVFKNGTGSDATVICGLDWIAAWNANHPLEAEDIDVVNMSLRGPATPNAHPGCATPGNSDLEELAVCAVVAAGATVVVAAGNETQPVSGFIPSRYESVITVSALTDFDGQPGGNGSLPGGCAPPRGTETDDAFARYSNFGPEVDVIAPGTCVVSTDLGRAHGTTVMSGTSMATPHVSGSLARYLAVDPLITPAQLRHRVVAAGTLDWRTATDPDSHPDRLVDVDALLEDTAGLALFASPRTVPVRAGETEATVDLGIQRAGGFAGDVTLGHDGLPDGVSGASFSGASDPGLRDLVRTLTISFVPAPADGERTMTVTASGDAPGDPSTDLELALRFDGTPPSVGSPWPRITLKPSRWLDRARVRLAWSASDPQGPLARQDVLRAIGVGSFSTLAKLGGGATSYETSLDRRTKTSFRIKVLDQVANQVLSDTLKVRLLPTQSGKAILSGRWTDRSRRSASNGDLIRTTKAGSSATLAFTGRGVGVVAPTGPAKGVIKVRIDDQPVGTVDLSSGPEGAKRVVFASDDLPSGPHTITVIAKSGIVDLDAFLVLK